MSRQEFSSVETREPSSSRALDDGILGNDFALWAVGTVFRIPVLVEIRCETGMRISVVFLNKLSSPPFCQHFLHDISS